MEPPSPEGLTPDQGVGVVPVDGGEPPAAAPPTTQDLLAQAMSSVQLPVPRVRTAPTNKTYVRMRTSLWVEGVNAVKTAPIGAPQLQATATPGSVDWDLGEKKLHCDDLGTKSGKTCHYVYQRSSAGQQGNSYKITATVQWRITWKCLLPGCNPPGGDLPQQPTTSVPTPLTVSEIQTNTGQ
ncbi:hypothetical protein E1298_42190 [Actinomadura rubrisoli]|uniref:Uncharacterized protein n=2 Tax=Actinomadura rubrisoli TaxID=2530368 RepID=A0A4R5A2B4_9ACTN|nr:hypothetical protein E1298_42190 [Actinomadura rubrisoli]